MHFSRNIIILFILRAVRWFLLIMPIITIYYKDNGLSMQDIFVIQSIFSISVVLFEIPTGYFSDVVGRKKSLSLGMILGALWIGVYALSSWFWSFLIAELILWLGSSFISGTDSAMLYDTLLDEWKQKNNKKIQWYLQTISSISEWSASLIGGFLAFISITLPFYVQFCVYLASLPLLFLLREPKRHKHENTEWIWKWIVKIVRYSLHEHKEIKWLIFFSWAFGASTLVMTWFLQSYFVLVWVPIVYFGILWSVYNLSLIPISLFAHRIEEYFWARRSLIFISLFPVVGFLSLSYFDSIFALIFVFCFYIARGFGSVVLNDYVNILVTSDIRATVLSVQALMYRLVFVVVGPFLGWMSDIYSLQTAFFLSSIIFSSFFITSLVFLLRHKA